MGRDKIRHLIERSGRYFWQPSTTILALGLSAEALGSDPVGAERRAAELNVLADELRRLSKPGSNGPKPGSVSRLFRDYRVSEEFDYLKPRTQRDYVYYMEKIEIDMGHIMVRSLTPRVIKVHYRNVRNSRGITWAYHILATWRTLLSWGVSEDWLASNPALEVTMKSPKKRTQTWTPEQGEAYIKVAKDLGYDSIVAMVRVFDSIGQSPIDVRTLLRKCYDGRAIDVSRAKTGETGAPIPLFPKAVEALDEYLADQTAKLPDAPLFTNDEIGGMWNESTLGKVHRKIREAAKLPKELQLQDFRTTAATEGGAAGATRDELRGLLRHATGDASEHYVHPNHVYVENMQTKRLALRAKKLESKK